MSPSRLSQWLPQSVRAASPASVPFLACPAAVWQTLPAGQQGAAVELYRLAAEQTRVALRPEPSERLYQFSAN